MIYVVRNLWEYTAHRDCRNADAAGTCEQILAYLSFPLWSQPSEAACKEQHSGEERSLQTQLDQLRPGVLDFSFAMMPLSHYFYAAACRTESEYPLWLYKTCIQPWLGLYVSGELCFGKAMQVVYDLFRSDDETRKADYFPLLYDILVEPVGTIV